MWYERYALRKHHLNLDLHIHSLEDPATGADVQADLQERHVKDIIGSAIIRGLDIIGIVSRNSYDAGNLGKMVAQREQFDITVLSGIEIDTSEGLNLVVFDANPPPQPGGSFEDICTRAHSGGGIVMAIQPNRLNTQRLNKTAGYPSGPDFVEIYNDVTQGGYLKAFTDTGVDPEFIQLINSAARNANDLDTSEMMSRVPRKSLVEKGMLEEEEGVNYIPPYLRDIETPGGPEQWPTAPLQM